MAIGRYSAAEAAVMIGCAYRRAAYLHDHSDASDEVSSLLADLGTLVVEAPLDSTADLGQVRLGAHLQAVDYSAKAIQHHICVITDLHINWKIS